MTKYTRGLGAAAVLFGIVALIVMLGRGSFSQEVLKGVVTERRDYIHWTDASNWTRIVCRVDADGFDQCVCEAVGTGYCYQLTDPAHLESTDTGFYRPDGTDDIAFVLEGQEIARQVK